MTDISVNEFLKQAINTAEHFGFRSDENWRKRKECVECKSVKGATMAKADIRRQDGAFGLITGGVNTYISNKLHAIEEPIFYYNIESTPRTNEASVVFQIYGVQKSIAESILIQTIKSFLNDAGYSDHLVKINSLGDNDSQQRYTRELTTFFRKKMDEMPPNARELMKEHVSSALLHLIEKNHDLAFKSPSPMEYLSDQSRKHFREIVEFLDMSETPYEIDPKLIGHYGCYHDAIFAFELVDQNGYQVENQPFKIRGGRYGTLLEKHCNKNTPATGAVITLKGKNLPTRLPKMSTKKSPIHLIHIGFAPKVRALLLLNDLRKAGISVNQNLATDSLSEQLRKAEESGAKYTLIIGQKEFVDNTIILRDMSGKNQETISINKLATRLKSLNT